MWFHSYLQVPLQGAQALGVPKITMEYMMYMLMLMHCRYCRMIKHGRSLLSFLHHGTKTCIFFLPFLLASLSLQMLQVVWLRKMTIFNVVVVIVTK